MIVPNKTGGGHHVEAPYGKARSGDKYLREGVPSSFANLYGKNIAENSEFGEDAMSNAIMASFYHNCDGPFASNKDRDEKYDHLCPNDAWCKWRTNKIYAKGLLSEVRRDAREEIKEIFITMSDKDLLKRCKLNLSQNVNESLHMKLYSKARKGINHGVKRLKCVSKSTVLEHNFGKTAASLLPLLGPVTKRTINILNRKYKDSQRVAKARANNPDRRRNRRRNRVPNNANNNDYNPGMY